VSPKDEIAWVQFCRDAREPCLADCRRDRGRSAQERVEQRPDDFVRITLKKAYADGTIAVDMDPLSLLCRLT
jgi:hypothetical protein